MDPGAAHGNAADILTRLAAKKSIPTGRLDELSDQGVVPMLRPLLDPDVADVAPDAPILTGYDEERLLTYIRLLDAAAENAD